MASGTANKKCGEINVSIKKNGKRVFSFNCWFCDTICLQMKKFTVHLEQEHNGQLEEATKEVTYSDIELEDQFLKSENEEETHVFVGSPEQTETTSSFRDPLETAFKANENVTTIEIPKKELNRDVSMLSENSELNTPLTAEHETQKVDAEMKIISIEDDSDNVNSYANLSADGNSSSSDYSADDSDDEEQLTKWFKRKYARPLENELIVPLLKAFKDIPQLWDTSQAIKYNLNKKSELLKPMIEHLNGQLKAKLKLGTVRKTLSSICSQYEQEIEREMRRKGEEKSDLWFYEHVKFMRKATERRLKNKKRPKCRLKPLRDDQICDLVDIYKNYSQLWDVNNLAFPIKEKRHETMQIMLEEIKDKMNLTLNVPKLRRHLTHVHKAYAKEKQRQLECETNEQQFKASSTYYARCDFLKLSQGPFRCSTCNEIIDTYTDFQIHKSSHNGSMPFICPDCGMGFKKTSYYNTHVKRHLGFFKFHCEICGKGYPFNAELEEHMRSHTGALPYLCSICGEGFGRASSYDNHIRRHEERFKYFCEICKKGFNCLTRLKDHVKAHLNVRDAVCTVCGKSFTSRRYLGQHKRVHTTKNCICNICGKGFANDFGLRAHKKYHESGNSILNSST